MPAHSEYNAAGYWESQDIVDINEQFLVAAGSCWDDVLPIDFSKIQPDLLCGFISRAEELLNRDFTRSHWFVLKDPRIGRLLRLWIPAVEACGAQPKVIIPIRHPLEVAASLHRREGFSEDKSIYLWLRHMVVALRDSRNVPRAILFFDELMLDWKVAVKRLAKDIDVAWPKELDEVAPMIEKFLDPNLRHYMHKTARPQVGGWVGRLAVELYVALCERASNLEELVDSIHAQLVPFENVFAPLQKDSIRKIALVNKEREKIGVDLSLLAQEFEDKVRHVELLMREIEELHEQQKHAQSQLTNYEQTVGAERKLHTELVAAFEDKERHVELLTREIEELHEQQKHAQSQLTNYEQTVGAERKLHTELVAAFEDKERHVELLTREIEELHEQQKHAQSQLTNYEQTVGAERKLHTELVAAFEDKERHAELLTREIEELHEQQQNAQALVEKLLFALEQAKNTIEEINKII